MDWPTAFTVIIPCTFSFAVSAFSIYLSWRRHEDAREELLWRTALDLARDVRAQMGNEDDFARIYENLKFFRDNGGSLRGELGINELRNKLQSAPPQSRQCR